jgi:hypothetical protein
MLEAAEHVAEEEHEAEAVIVEVAEHVAAANVVAGRAVVVNGVAVVDPEVANEEKPVNEVVERVEVNEVPALAVASVVDWAAVSVAASAGEVPLGATTDPAGSAVPAGSQAASAQAVEGNVPAKEEGA